MAATTTPAGWADRPDPTSAGPARRRRPPSPGLRADRSADAPPRAGGCRSRPTRGQPARRRLPLAAALALAALAGGASGAGVVAADQYWSAAPTGDRAGAPRAGQRRQPRPAGAPRRRPARSCPASCRSGPGRGSGSGVIIDGAGHVLTNHHVVAGARTVSLVLSTGRTVSAEVVGSDAEQRHRRAAGRRRRPAGRDPRRQRRPPDRSAGDRRRLAAGPQRHGDLGRGERPGAALDRARR